MVPLPPAGGAGGGHENVPDLSDPPLTPPANGRGTGADRPVVLAVVTGAHGLAGEVRLKLFGEGADALKRYKAFNGGTLHLTSIKAVKGGAVASFGEWADRTAAERARGTELTVPRSALPPLGEGEYYHHDLIGLPAITTAGDPLGTVVLVENFGAGDILEIERPNGKRFMVPMNRDAVPEWGGEGVVVDAGWVP